MGELVVCKSGQNSIAVAPESEEEFRKIGDGELFTVEFHRPRNLPFHRKFFALLKVAFENQEFYATMEQFRTAVLVGLGWCETFILQSGEVCYIPKSISFAKMKQDEFERVYSDVLDYLVREHVCGTDPRQLSYEAERILRFV